MDKTDSVSLIIEQNDTDPTLRYYEDHAEEFTANTIDADMKDIRSRFLSHLPAGARILDFGCGTGRDTKAFLDLLHCAGLPASIPAFLCSAWISGSILRQRKYMRLIGNILWFLLGGFVSGMAWVLSGAVWCITIIGIPYGLQCFKFAGLSFWPFGRRIEYGGGAVSFIVNVIWFLLNGWWMALGNLAIGCVWCITIIGIPFGIQFFKIAKLSLSPFGATIVRD